MSNLINNYPVFESSQVLTSSQLNRITSYLDQQNRLTRTQLIGMGIVCGLNIGFDDSGGDLKITISKGTAITSEGFLITLGNITTSWMRPYILPSGVSYSPFDKTDPPITLYELLCEQPEDDSDVVPLSDDPSFLDDKFVLLFLEIFDNDLKACLGNTCDDLGIDRIFSIRKLLISKSDLNELLEHTSNVGSFNKKKYDLPQVVMPRTIFNPGQNHSTQYPHFSAHIAANAEPVFKALFGDGSNNGALHKSYSAYASLLADKYEFENPFETSAVTNRIADWKNYLQDAKNTGTNTHGIQYFSDFLKDLVLAYDQFRAVAFEVGSECSLDTSRFPQHIMLGRANHPKETPQEQLKYRHGFVQPPIYNHQKDLIEEAVFLHRRLVLLLHSFDIDLIRTPESGPVPEIHITPSNEKQGYLSERSIPYYYDLDQSASGIDGTLEAYWSFEITKTTKTTADPPILAHQNQAVDQSNPLNPLETPLYFDLDSYPFFRIEGYLGKTVEDVSDRITGLRRDFALPFDFVTLRLEDDGETVSSDYECGFEDIQEEFEAATRTYCGFIRDLVSLLEFAAKNRTVLFDDDEETIADLEDIRKIAESLYTLCETLTVCLNEFDFGEFQSRYKTSLEKLIHFIFVKKELLDNIEIKSGDEKESIPVINGLMSHLSPLVFRLADSLFYNTFERIYRSFKRREYYLVQRKRVFSSYLRNHGFEHQAGVPKGGTFIALYQSTDDQRVIADFSLPYRCCSDSGCVPMCGDDAEFQLSIKPFARPDLAITTIGRPIEINVSHNDLHHAKNTWVVELDDNETELGHIETVNEKGLLRYKPKDESSGYDRFDYVLIDKESGLKDMGTVMVLINGEAAGGCYPADVLVCWANNDKKKIQNFYNRRHPNNPIEGDIPTIAAALHSSLKASRGFTEEELDSLNPMESTTERRLLLKCIDPNTPVDQMEWQELGDMIRQYQNKNCKEKEKPLKECYSLDTLDCWNGGNLDLLVNFYNQRNPNNMISGGSQSEVYRAVRDDLRRTGGFTEQEVRSGILASDDQKMVLLNCLDIPFSENMSSQQLGDLILRYQTENCGRGGTDTGEIPRVELSAAELSAKELTAVLHARGVDVSENESEDVMISALKNTTGGLTFSKAEVMLFTKNRMTDILKNRGISASSGATKEILANNLFRK